jgi:hypothetical protein
MQTKGGSTGIAGNQFIHKGIYFRKIVLPKHIHTRKRSISALEQMVIASFTGSSKEQV